MCAICIYMIYMYLAKYKGRLCSAKMQIFNFAFATAVSASRGAKSIAPNYMRVDISPFAALEVLELRMYRPCQCLPCQHYRKCLPLQGRQWGAHLVVGPKVGRIRTTSGSSVHAESVFKVTQYAMPCKKYHAHCSSFTLCYRRFQHILA